MSPLFVYGSLKRGFRHHQRMQSAEFVSEAQTAAGFRLVTSGQYPALVRGGTGSVRGELYLVDQAQLSELDVFEGCPELYQRVTIELCDGSSVEAYLLAENLSEDCIEIASGVWSETPG